VQLAALDVCLRVMFLLRPLLICGEPLHTLLVTSIQCIFSPCSVCNVASKHSVNECVHFSPCMAECLADVIGLEWEFVHDEACRWEHVMSEQVERKILGLIQNPDVSPYGNPIPGLDALGFQGNNGFKDGVTSVTALDEKLLDGREFVLRRIGEPLQMDSNLLLRFKFLGILPGSSVTLSRSGEGWRICASSADQGLLLRNSDAMHLFVESPSTQ
jgi:Fe2+ transport system protein FeoA